MTRWVTSVDEVRSESMAARRAGRVVGLVPTMGALHDGHVRLVERCRAESDLTIVSVFVNPTQFGPAEDFQRYPRTPEADLLACQSAGADLVFAPTADAMYPNGLAASTFVEVPGLSDVLEGASRPGHFRGVATVVLKLFQATAPDIAYFGQKDYQQLCVIRRMVEDLNSPVSVRSLPTVREPDGLAMSSRNRYLDGPQRRSAAVLFRALGAARAAVAGGERDANRVRQILTRTIESELRAVIDYAEVADPLTLDALSTIPEGRGAVGLLAVRVGATRLIDNAVLTE